MVFVTGPLCSGKRTFFVEILWIHKFCFHGIAEVARAKLLTSFSGL